MKIIIYGKETVELSLTAEDVAQLLEGDQIEKQLGDDSEIDLSGVENWLVTCG